MTVPRGTRTTGGGRAMPPSATATGGCFSVGYIVRQAVHGQAFLKALDYSRAFRAQDMPRVMQAMVNAFLFEKDMLDLCGAKRMDRVVRALAGSQVDVPGGAHPVNYLIFEQADGDVRAALDAVAAFDAVWVLRVLHNVAVGLQQLHREGIAHQDLKPSNTLVFGGHVSKVADLGCADQKGRECPRGGLEIAGIRSTPLRSFSTARWRVTGEHADRPPISTTSVA